VPLDYVAPTLKRLRSTEKELGKFGGSHKRLSLALAALTSVGVRGKQCAPSAFI
jgi:hypothetical protein